MEYIYGALILQAVGKKITEKSLTKVLKAANIDVEKARVKMLVESLETVDIDKAISSATPSIQVKK